MPRAPSIYKQWEIWQVEWLHEDRTSKPRPALLFSPDSHNIGPGPWLFLKISTREYKNAPSIIPVRLDDPIFAGCGLGVDSFIYPAKPQRITKGSIYYVKGMIGRDAQKLVVKEIMRVVGWPFREPR